jgi:hypothetical protein
MNNTKLVTLRLIMFLLITIIFLNLVFASSLDNAKDVVDKYYLYSKEKDVDNYALLFDQDYLKESYGEDYKLFFKEVLNYIDITKYEINYQYYTESEDSISLFFNLQAQTIIDNEKVKMDNDLVALFIKKENKLYLKSIILQETFIEQMNREVIYNAAISSFIEEGSDLKIEAENKGISLIDFEKLIDKSLKHEKSSSIKTVLLLLLLIFIVFGLMIIFKNKIKSKKINNYLNKSQDYIVKGYNNLFNIIKETYKKIKPYIKDFVKKIKPHIKKIIMIIYENSIKLFMFTKKETKKLIVMVNKRINKQKIKSSKKNK